MDLNISVHGWAHTFISCVSAVWDDRVKSAVDELKNTLVGTSSLWDHDRKLKRVTLKQGVETTQVYQTISVDTFQAHLMLDIFEQLATTEYSGTAWSMVAFVDTRDRIRNHLSVMAV